jgi:adenine-specific DNA methylase
MSPQLRLSFSIPVAREPGRADPAAAPVQPWLPAPNPHLGDLVDGTRPAKAVDRPYAYAISAGKNSYVYDAHTYHTKVPPQGIRRLIEYYTRPGDTILDPFCGSGMTGVAATDAGGRAILSDLSPAATFIAYNLNTPIDSRLYLRAVSELLNGARELERSLYNTHCRACGRAVPLLYTVWSFRARCGYCHSEFSLWDVARDERRRVRDSKVKSEFDCPHCGKLLSKRSLVRTSRHPVQIGYRCCGAALKECTADPDLHDREILARIEASGVPAGLWYPTDRFPQGMNTRQPLAAGIDSVDKAYTPRALWAMAYLWDQARQWPDEPVRSKLLFTLTSLYQRVTVFSEFRFWGGSSNTANYNVPAIMNEQNVFKTFERKANTISWYFREAAATPREVLISTQSACHLPQLPDQSVDYVFTDPPFGGNINYSEMNFLWESWLQNFTDNTEEAIVNRVQGKGVEEYAELLTRAFTEVRRVLKNEAWLTVVFHNSSSRVWVALQRAISDAGFSIDGTQTFDKKHGTFKQFVSDNAVGYDLVLHCRKSIQNHRLLVPNRETIRQQIKEFVEHALQDSPPRYVVTYLHVSRAAEFDYRRLYADWLSHSLPEGLVSLSFEEFRKIAGGATQLGQLERRRRLVQRKTRWRK